MKSRLPLSAGQLRREIAARAASLARDNSLLHEIAPGDAGILFGREEDEEQGCGQARHGNFHPASYAAICANPEWLRRLAKPHTASRRSRARKDWRWMELDSACSSDALLMNIFCHPGVFDGARLAPPVAALLNVEVEAAPCFGVRPGVPLRATFKQRSAKAAPRERLDQTEIDLTLATPAATLLVEAKLTEPDFQDATPELLARYRDLDAVFDVERLPRKTLIAQLPPNVDPDDPTVNLTARPQRIRMEGYQLIRNVLAAYAASASFCVLCDARRHDLTESWYAVLAAVRSLSFATRLKLLTWQELSGALPIDLQQFLVTKYGIES
jgi:hypothetical protein